MRDLLSSVDHGDGLSDGPELSRASAVERETEEISAHLRSSSYEEEHHDFERDGDGVCTAGFR